MAKPKLNLTNRTPVVVNNFLSGQSQNDRRSLGSRQAQASKVVADDYANETFEKIEPKKVIPVAKTIDIRRHTSSMTNRPKANSNLLAKATAKQSSIPTRAPAQVITSPKQAPIV